MLLTGRFLIFQCLAVLFCAPAFAFAQPDSTVIHLWKNGAPGFESRRNEPEKGGKYLSNIHNPSITVFLPSKDKATGAAVLICPGGGHRILVIEAEGYEAAHYFNSIGIAAIVLKYRLARDGSPANPSPYNLEVHARQDANRAMRTIRLNAEKWGIDAGRIGMMGFSAGGEVVDQVAFASGSGNAGSSEAVEKLSAKPNFIIQVYPGPLDAPETVPADAPPAFLVVANRDSCCSTPTMSILNAYRKAGLSVEAHIYSKGAHAFNMGYRTKIQSLHAWPQRLTDWFADNNFFKP